MDIDLEELAAMVAILKEMEFSEFRYEKGELLIEIRRGSSASGRRGEPGAESADTRATAGMNGQSGAAVVPSPALTRATARPAMHAGPDAAQAPVVAEGVHSVAAPLLGTFYCQPKPGEAPFVSVGDFVEPETVVCIIEVMKLMNSVVAGVRGVVAAVHVADGDLVEHGQRLFSVTPVLD